MPLLPVRRAALVRAVRAFLSALVLTTCSTDSAVGPGPVVQGSMDVTGLLRAGGSIPIPVDTVLIELRRTSDSSVAFSQLISAARFTARNDSLIVPIQVTLSTSPEQFYLYAEARGGGIVYYSVRAVVTASSGQTTPTPPLDPTYVGPGNAADSVQLFLASSSVAAGDSVLAFAVVWQGGAVVQGVPVGITSSDTLVVRTRPQGLDSAWVFAVPGATGGVTLTALTPNDLTRTAPIAIAPAAAALVEVSGDSQQVGTGQPSQPLVVQVRDALNQPYTSGFTVNFALVNPPAGTTIAPASAVTNANGFAQAVVTAGGTAGTANVSVTAAGLTGSPLLFTMDVLGGPPSGPATVTAASATSQSATVNQLVGAAPSVLVRDSSNAPLAGVTVTFAVSAGGGAVTGPTVVTSGTGIATVGSWRVGTGAGANAVTATVTGLPVVTFNATGTAGVPDTVLVVSGDSQTVAAGSALPLPLVVEVQDSFSNVVAGATVAWATPSGGSLAPTSGPTAANGRAQTVWTLGPSAPTQTATATVGALAPAGFTATATFGAPALSLVFVGVPDVGLGKSAAVRASLPSPAPAGGVIVTLASDAPGTVQVVNTADTIPAGQTAADFTVNGIALGSTTLRANASGFLEGVLPIVVQDRSISVPPTLNVPFGQTASVVINIGSPAPVGGVVITVTSDNPTVVGVQTPTVTIPAGATSTNATVQGLLPGTANVTVDNPAFTTDVVVVTTSASLNVVETFVQPNASFPIGINIQLTSAGVGIAAPAGGVSVTLVARNTACVLTNSPRTIAAGLVATTATLSAGAGPLPCTTYVVAQASNIQSDSVQVSVSPTPGISTSANVTIGAGLQVSGFASLGASNHGGVTVRVASSDSSRILIAPNTTTPGTGFIDVPVIAGGTGVSFVTQALKGTAGNVVPVTLTAPGFATATINDSIAPAAMDIIFLVSASTTFSPNDPFQVRTGVPNAANTAMSLEQAIRAGAAPDTFTVVNDSAAVAQLVTTAFTGQVVTTLIQPAQARSPGNAASGGVEFDPTGAGVTTISASGAGYISLPQPTPKYQVTVSAPLITLNTPSAVGSGMQVGGNAFLGASNHGGIDVTLQVSDSSMFLLAPNASTVGSGTRVVHLNNGTGSLAYTLQALEGMTGSATIVASAPGFVPDTITVTAVAPALDVIFLPGSIASLAPSVGFQVRLGTPNPQLTAISVEQALRAGSPGVTVLVTHADPVAAKLFNGTVNGDTVTTTVSAQQARSPSGTANGGLEYDPVAPGSDTVSATAPGFLVLPSASQPITVTGQAITLSNLPTIGAGMQTGSSGFLGASNHGGITVRLVSSDSSRFLLARSAGDTLGGGTLDIVVPNGNTSFSYTLQVLEGPPASATITATAPGFTTANTTATAVQPAFDVIFLNTTQTTFSPNNDFQVRVGVPNGQLTGIQQEFVLRFGSPGVTAALTSSVPGVGALVTQAGSSGSGSVTIGARGSRSPSPVSNGGVAFDPLIGGTTTVSATIPGYLTLPTASVVVTVSAPGISMSAPTVGAGLQSTGSVFLGASNHGGVTVRITSSQPQIALVSASASVAGSTFIDVPLGNGQSSISYFVQGVDTVTAPILVAMTATAPGFTDGTATATVQQPALDIIFLNTSPTTLSPANSFQVRIGVPNANNTAMQLEQQLSPSSVARTATVSNSNATTGQLIFQGGPAQSGTVPMAIQQSRSPSPATAGGVEFLAGAAGTTVVSATIPGFITLPTAIQTVTVSTPGIGVSPVTVGSGLMFSSFGSLGASNHGGVTVQVTSANPALFLLAPNTTTTPTASLNIPLTNGQVSFSYVVHGLEGVTGTAQLSVTAPGFVSANVTETVVQPAADPIFLPSSISAGAASTDFQVRIGIPDGLGNSIAQEQALRFGATPLAVTVSNSNATAGQLVSGAGTGQTGTTTIAAGVARSPTPLASGGVQFDPLAQGVTAVSVAIPGYRVLPASSFNITVGP